MTVGDTSPKPINLFLVGRACSLHRNSRNGFPPTLQYDDVSLLFTSALRVASRATNQVGHGSSKCMLQDPYLLGGTKDVVGTPQSEEAEFPK